MRKNTILAISLLLVFFILTFFYPVWVRTPGGFWLILFNLAILISACWIILRIIVEIIQLIKNRKNLTFKELIPLLILLGGSYILLTIPGNLEDELYGKVKFRACYEGTQNQATFKLRGKDRFEIHYTGAFFADSFVGGKYQCHGDTLFLTYDHKVDQRFGDKVLMDDSSEYLVPIRGDSLIISRLNFYYGYCKGLN